jgi:hypothetical protein
MSMSPINPLAGTLMGGAVAQSTAESEKTGQLRRRQIQTRDIATRDDELEHQVESSQQVDPATNDQHNSPDRRRAHRQHSTNDADGEGSDSQVEHLDVTA